MRSEGSDEGAWSAFWMAVLKNSADFLSIFFVCDLDSCILIKTSRVRGKGQAICYAPSSIYVFLHGCRGHTCCPYVMLLFLVPVPGTFLLLSSFDSSLAIAPCNEVIPHCMPHRGLSPFLLIATPIPIPQLVYKLQ